MKRALIPQPTRQAIVGSLNKNVRNMRPRHNEINWSATIRRSLKHYQPEYNTIIPETRIGYGRKRSSLKDVILCLDQSGSMGSSRLNSPIIMSISPPFCP
jgi:Mg-chelatase subunit ChlD